MKVWFEAIMESGDDDKRCSYCKRVIKVPELIFVENSIVSGSPPNPNELHPEPTGRFMCLKCGKSTLF